MIFNNIHSYLFKGSIFLIILLVNQLHSMSFADCDNGEKAECFCECESIDADAKGFGPCSVTEKENRWCSISYGGHTGSLGEDSMGPNFSTELNPRDLHLRFSSNIPQLPDHRTSEYSNIINDLNKTIWYDIQRRVGLHLNDGRPKRDAQFLMLVWLRASYISSRNITRSEISRLDRIVSIIFSDEYDINTFFFGSGNIDLQFNALNARYFVAPGFFRITSDDFKLKLIFRDYIGR